MKVFGKSDKLYSDKSRRSHFLGLLVLISAIILVIPVRTYAKSRTLDIIVFAGQSNMMGHGTASQTPAVKKGTAYSYLPVSAPGKLSAFSEPFGRNENDLYFNNIMGTENYATGSLSAAFIKSYYAKTGTPVLAVPAAMMGTGSHSWAYDRYRGVIARIKSAKKAAEKKGYEVGHTYMVWLQGESDALAMQRNADGSCDSGMKESVYIRNIRKMYSRIEAKTDLSVCFVIVIPSYYGGQTDPYGTAWSSYYKRIQKAQIKLCSDFDEFEMIYEKTPTLPVSYIQSDGMHITQSGLNKIGTAAGRKAGAYAVND